MSIPRVVSPSPRHTRPAAPAVKPKLKRKKPRRPAPIDVAIAKLEATKKRVEGEVKELELARAIVADTKPKVLSAEERIALIKASAPRPRPPPISKPPVTPHTPPPRFPRWMDLEIAAAEA